MITYNSSKYVVETLNSIKSQTYSNIELVISDDCSADDTVEACRLWLDKDENKGRFQRSEIVTAVKNTGTPSNCNRGIRAAQGEWLKLIAGDDILMEDCVKDNLLFTEANPGIQIVQSECEVFRNTFAPENYIRRSDLKTNPIYKEGINAREQFQILLKRNCVLAAAIFIKKAVLDEAGGYDENFHYIEDHTMWLKLTKDDYKIGFLNKATVKYRLSESSVTKGGKPYTPEKYAREFLSLMRKYKDEITYPRLLYYSSLIGIRSIIVLNQWRLNTNSLFSKFLFKTAYFFLFLGRRRYRIVFKKS